MPQRRNYPRPPIVEAVIELRFAADAPATRLLDCIRPSLGERYAGGERVQNRMEFSAEVGPHGASSSVSQRPHLTLLESTDGLRSIGCADQTLSVHVLAPYPGWENFIALAVEAVEVLPAELLEPGFAALAVRYIDRIALPAEEAPRPTDYFTVLARPTASMPGETNGFHLVTQSWDAASGTAAMLTIASMPPDEQGRPLVLYDLNLLKLANPDPLPHHGWRDCVEHLHVRQRDIFEESITDRTRELFQ